MAVSLLRARKMTRSVDLKPGELEKLIRENQDKGYAGMVKVSFGPGGSSIDPDEQPHHAQRIRDLRDEQDGRLFDKGLGI